VKLDHVSIAYKQPLKCRASSPFPENLTRSSSPKRPDIKADNISSGHFLGDAWIKSLVDFRRAKQIFEDGDGSLAPLPDALDPVSLAGMAG
jgi:hypothetical protein